MLLVSFFFKWNGEENKSSRCAAAMSRHPLQVYAQVFLRLWVYFQGEIGSKKKIKNLETFYFKMIMHLSCTF